MGMTLLPVLTREPPRARVVQRTRLSFSAKLKSGTAAILTSVPSTSSSTTSSYSAMSFYQEIASHPIPTDLESVKAISDSPAVLDFLIWLSYRCFIAKGDESIPLLRPYLLAAQVGSAECARPRRFRENVEK
jgi:hypothetical protein